MKRLSSTTTPTERMEYQNITKIGYDEWLAAIDAEVEAMISCVCRFPNFAPGVCMLCGRKENLGKEAQEKCQ